MIFFEFSRIDIKLQNHADLVGLARFRPAQQQLPGPSEEQNHAIDFVDIV